uniref:Uncharacterized protein n=1 Tax=Leersia perrieri TaxID=77586 RepID=A0A0D9WBY2_9ORYZ
MVIELPSDNQYTITETQQTYDGSSSSSQQQPSLYNYSLSNTQFFSQPATGSRTYLSGEVTSPATYSDKNYLGQTQFQIDAGGNPEYQTIRSNNALYYISQMLMEEVDERVSLHQGEAALQAAEKPFYDILGQVYPPPRNRLPMHSANDPDILDENASSSSSIYHSRLHNSHSNYKMLQPLPTPLSPYSYGRSLFLPNQQLVSTAWTSKVCIPGLQMRRGVEEAKRFVPIIDKFVIDLDTDRLSISKMTTKAKVGDKKRYAIFEVTDQRSNPYIRDLDILEGRSSKRYAITYCEIIRNEVFDRVLLCYGVKNFTEASNLREIMVKETSKNSLNGQNKGSQRKLRGKKQLKKDVVDLRSLLIQCAQAVAADDRILASELVKKIRQHSSADGDSNQRLAFYLVDGLDARLAGIGSQVHRKLMARRISTENMLKAYSLYLSACPFERASFAFANQTILDASKGQQPRKVHIVDFGICTGFQWPSLIQQFANEGSPPKLRITGIDMPQPGFHPCKIIEETGKRLADYANLFKVPFQYQGIASRWETIQIEDLNIDKDEVLIINCMFRMKNLGDETVAMNSARDRVLKTMRMMNPRVFILGIVNGSYSSPFFITRFKEVLFHYSSLFDMIDANVPRDNETRKMLERGFFGKDALNIIACEGAERTERPESYKQWQARCLKAGFKQLPVDPATLKVIIDMKKEIYHEDFVADEDGGWLLQGWKGRVIYAISTWKPNESFSDHIKKKVTRNNHNINQPDANKKATEKPFYDILGKVYPSSKETSDNGSSNYHEHACSGSCSKDLVGSQSAHSITTNWSSEFDCLVLQFRRGVEEAKNFVPNIEKLMDDPEKNAFSACKQTTEATGQKSKHENNIRDHPHVEDLELKEARNSKHLAISISGIIRDEMFDSVLLCNRQLPGEVAHLRGMMAKEAGDNPKKAQRKGYGQGQRKPSSKKKHMEAIDLRVLLIQCAQAIACSNHPFASELLKKIRLHASPHGDGSQRLANCFADGLEARLAGTGSQMYENLMAKQTSTKDMLKAYHLYVVACPFEMVTYYFCNKTIIDVLKGKPALHIIDFGILFGFQWPCLIQRLAKREGGPPKLRITGIDVPQPGFRPHGRIEETGKRLAEYAHMFGVPFQYHGIASRWETICIEDLRIDNDEVLIINCMSRMRKLGDETENIDSARDRVLRMMKRMNPEVFVLGVVNGLYSSPFFLTRFREVLFHYSSLFDMLDTNVPRNHEGRILVEKDLFGNDALNVVACEGAERTERPESYKQWQMRILRAGFEQHPIDHAILKRSVHYKELYHEDFVIDEDSGWLLQGWKGRIMHALSTWKPR